MLTLNILLCIILHEYFFQQLCHKTDDKEIVQMVQGKMNHEVSGVDKAVCTRL